MKILGGLEGQNHVRKVSESLQLGAHFVEGVVENELGGENTLSSGKQWKEA